VSKALREIRGRLALLAIKVLRASKVFRALKE
jgi:hypothetical protein